MDRPIILVRWVFIPHKLHWKSVLRACTRFFLSCASNGILTSDLSCNTSTMYALHNINQCVLQPGCKRTVHRKVYKTGNRRRVGRKRQANATTRTHGVRKWELGSQKRKHKTIQNGFFFLLTELMRSNCWHTCTLTHPCTCKMSKWIGSARIPFGIHILYYQRQFNQWSSTSTTCTHKNIQFFCIFFSVSHK